MIVPKIPLPMICFHHATRTQQIVPFEQTLNMLQSIMPEHLSQQEIAYGLLIAYHARTMVLIASGQTVRFAPEVN